tara:strand:- start:379 stop:774 length:396 start_codon:yes stop_codon:yes gene_type:complete
MNMKDAENKNRKSRIGLVVSDKLQKTVVVSVVRNVRHPIYHKVLKRTKKYQVHDPENQATLGDIVRIEESNPISKHKKWKLVEVVTDRDVAGISATEIDASLVTEIEQSAKKPIDKVDNVNSEENISEDLS